VSQAADSGDIIVFDSVCVFCTANARLVMRRDKAQRFRFASMQNELGKTLFRAAGLDPDNPESLVVLTNGQFLRDSEAVLHIYRHLGAPWRFVGLLRLVPQNLRDPVYRLIARNRYRWFGRRDECWVPGGQDRERML